MIWKSSLVTRKKWVLSVMFSGGILIMVFGLLRCILILMVSYNSFASILNNLRPLLPALQFPFRHSLLVIFTD